MRQSLHRVTDYVCITCSLGFLLPYLAFPELISLLSLPIHRPLALVCWSRDRHSTTACVLQHPPPRSPLMEWSKAKPHSSSIVCTRSHMRLHTLYTTACSRRLFLSRLLHPLLSSSPRVLELLLLHWRAARHVAEDVDWLVVVVGCPCLSLRGNLVVWARRMKITLLLVGKPRYYPCTYE